ncbi:MAG: hypothetical protein WBG50_18895 [Desulfomonilaceae bacterium]
MNESYASELPGERLEAVEVLFCHCKQRAKDSGGVDYISFPGSAGNAALEALPPL